ncbi:MAG TPA: MlaD family protein, partial [Spirochaetales bacterium]|nr:MlaD family protein [Spirochaetales bacterium]
MKFKIKYMDQIVGLFIIIALALFAVIVILVGMNQRWFAKDYRFHTVFSSAAGVAPGTAITMKGFTVGKIDKISLNENNMVDAQFHIYDTYYPLVVANSVLELTVSPIGLGSSLLFHPGKPPVDPLTMQVLTDPETGLALAGVPLAEGSFIPSTASAEGQAILEQELADASLRVLLYDGV